MKIEIKNLSKYYDRLILKNLNIKLENVHSVGIIGGSSCGKSTLLKQLSGMEFPEEGSIIINNKTVDEKTVKEYKESIGYVFQKHNLFPHLTIRENILLILKKIRKCDINRAEEIVDKLLEQFHLTPQADKKPNRISGGQAQRASIARALSTNPEIILLDEPTAALDPILTREVLFAIKELKKLGKDFIFVTHEISFLKEIADYVIFMNDGQIVEHGEVGRLKEPKTMLLEKFLAKEA